MLLKEIYQPLKTFVPGSGGGYNKNSFPITDGGSLFTIRYGDTQARFRSAFTFPIISDLDKMLDGMLDRFVKVTGSAQTT